MEVPFEGETGKGKASIAFGHLNSWRPSLMGPQKGIFSVVKSYREGG